MTRGTLFLPQSPEHWYDGVIAKKEGGKWEVDWDDGDTQDRLKDASEMRVVLKRIDVRLLSPPSALIY